MIGEPQIVIQLDKHRIVLSLPYDILSIENNCDEEDFTWNSNGTLATHVFKKAGATLLTLTFTWNSDGTLQKIVRT